jgi:tetratricopeptide (TPR) repeat protein
LPWVILLAALVVRIVYLVDIADSIYLKLPVLDSCWYHTKALDVLGGDYLAAGASFRMPLYVYFLAGCYAAFGRSPAGPLIIQAFLGAASCLLVYLIAKRLFGIIAGAAAGFAFAFYRMAVYSDGEILPTTLYMFLVLAAVWMLLRCLEERDSRKAGAVGLLLGLAFLSRPDVLAFALVVMVLTVFLGGAKRGLRLAATMAIVFTGFLMLLGVRNYLAYDKFHVFSPQGAVNLYIGNASFADGKTPVAPPTTYVYGIAMGPGEDSIVTGCRVAARESVGRELPDSELSEYYLRKTLAEIKTDFPRWAGLMLRKTYYFLDSYERSGIKPVHRFIDRETHVLKLPLATYALVMPLGLVGLAVSLWRRQGLALVVSAGLITFAALTIGFFVIWRFRLPAVPFMAVLGGYALSLMVEAAVRRRYGMLVALAAAAVGLWAFSNTRLFGVNDQNFLPAYIVNEGALYEAEGRYDEAIGIYMEAAGMAPGDSRPYYHIGRTYAAMGRMSEAEDYMERAVALNPNYKPFAFVSLGIALAREEKYEQAAGYLEKALEADPTLCIAAYNLGFCQYQLGLDEEAAATLSRAAGICGDDPAALVSISRMLISLGETEKGISLGESVLGRSPDNAEALYVVGLGYEAEGRYREAAAMFERALRYMPSSKELAEKIREMRNMGNP